MPKKTSTERVKAFRQRQRAQKPPKKPPKSLSQRLKEFRERRKALKDGMKPSQLDIQTSIIDNMDTSNASASLKISKVLLKTHIGSTNPVFLIPMCFVCLKTKKNLRKVSAEILTKLLFCVEQTDEFTKHISNGTKICTNCSDELNVSFLSKHTDPIFKQICLKNIIQFKNYVDQLTSVRNDNEGFEVMNIESTDLGIKRELNHDVFDDSTNFDQQAIETFEYITIKEEIFEEACDEVNESSERFEKCSKNPNLQSYSRKGQVLLPTSSVDAQLQPVDVKLESLVHKKEILEDICSEEAEEQLTNNLKASDKKEEVQLQYHNIKIEFLLPKKVITSVTEPEQRKQPLSFFVNKLFCCPICAKMCNDQEKFNLHLIVHINFLNGLYSCQICSQSFQMQETVIQHMSTHSTCNKQTYYSYSTSASGIASNKINTLTAHKLIDSTNGPFTCSTCNRAFITKAALSTHLLSHTTSVHKCWVCGKGFLSKAELSCHMPTHSNNRTYSTSAKSGIGSNKTSTLTAHKLIDSANESTHSNKQTSYSTSARSGIDSNKIDTSAHKLIDSSFTCSMCNRAFITKAALSNHLLSHKAKPIYMCRVCGNSFLSKEGLSSHMIIHRSQPFF